MSPHPLIALVALAALAGASSGQETLEQKAARIHREAIVIDTHADTTSHFEDPFYDFFERHREGHIDYPRAIEGGLDAQFWSIWMGSTPGDGTAVKRAIRRIDSVRELVRRHPAQLGLALCAEDVRRLHREGRFACLMGMEGGHMIENDLAALRTYHALGVRYLTLTHSFHTDWADSAGLFEPLEPRHHGLTALGCEVVREMNRLGMMVDLSHVSDETFWDALEVSRAPVLLSHSGCRAIAPGPRNASDEMLRALARNGGVIQIIYFPGYIDPSYPLARSKEMRALSRDDPKRYLTPISVVIDHIEHALAVAGPDHVGLGSDFDGIGDVPKGLEDVSRLPRITLELLRRGHSEETVVKVLGGNLLRVLENCEQVARRLADATPARREAREFLSAYTQRYLALQKTAAGAAWEANTHIGPEASAKQVAAEEELAAFVGRAEVLKGAQKLLEQRASLADLQIRQLERILRIGATRPGTIPDVVARLIRAEAAQTERLYGFRYHLGARAVTTNQIDSILRNSSDLAERRAAWEASKAVGKPLRAGLLELRALRNQVAREMGFHSFFDLQVADYGMSVAEMMAFMEDLVRELRPLQRELHTWARYTLAKRYGQPVPDLIPAHWLPNRWGQNWPGLVEGVDLDDLFAGRDARWVVEQAERFYVSMGFEKLPASFWERSDLYPLAADAARKKNNHASAWHIDLERDVRSLMSVEPNAYWFGTTHHELGHIYYYLTYSRPGVPPLLREGANRGFHEGIGDLIAIAAMQQPYLRQVGLLPAGRKIDKIRWLLAQALGESSIIFMPFAAGTMTRFEHDLYEEDLPAEQLNARWWELVRRYQGIAPPAPRGEEYCDAATKTHIDDDPAQYYDYAMANALRFHLHRTIAKKILGRGLLDANYYGSREVGDFLRALMRPGATRDWRGLLRELTGEDLSARAIREYFAPLEAWLRKANAGRKHTLAVL